MMMIRLKIRVFIVNVGLLFVSCYWRVTPLEESSELYNAILCTNRVDIYRKSILQRIKKSNMALRHLMYVGNACHHKTYPTRVRRCRDKLTHRTGTSTSGA